ncbi:MAG: DUF1302 family protein [Myxococcota bacterium]|nr:DUF1302 family protein [Myxococcota bacterium]
MDSATRLISRSVAGLVLGLLVSSQAAAFEAFDGRFQAHGFYEMQLRTLNADYSEDWDVTQWYHVFNLELEFDLLQDSVGILDLLSAYVRAEVRYDCIYSSGCGMFRSMNTYGDRSKSLPRRLANATSRTNSGEIPIRNEGREQSNTDPVPLSETLAFSGIAQTAGQFITGSKVGIGIPGTSSVKCDVNDSVFNRPGVNCFPDGQNGIKPFDYIFERFSDFHFTQVNTKGGGGSGLPVSILGPWLPKNSVATIATMSDRVNPFDNSRMNPVLNCRAFATADCFSLRLPGGGGRPFRPIPVFAEDRYRAGPEKTRVVVYKNNTNPALADPDDPSTYRIIEIDPARNHGDVRFQEGGPRQLLVTAKVRFPGEASATDRVVYDVRDLNRTAALPNLNYALPATSDFSLTNIFDPSGIIEGRNIASRTEVIDGQVVTTTADSQARGLFVPSKPLRKLLQKKDKLVPTWLLNLSENERAWNRGLSQRDEKELKEAYLDIELFDSQLWLRIGKQQIVWGKTELFRTTDQFNPQDLALATLPSLEESRIALFSARGIWSFYEVGPLEDVRLEIAANIDDFQPSDFGSCGEPYVVNLVCSANFGAFAHGFTGIGIIGIEKVREPWQSLKGWEIGGRIEWRWDKFSFALSDFWGYADLPSVRRISTYERNVDSQTGRPLVYQGGIDPAIRRTNLQKSFARDVAVKSDMATSLWNGIGQGNDPWEDPYGDLRALVVAQQAAPDTGAGSVANGDLPQFRDVRSLRTNGERVNCGTSRNDSDGIRYFEQGPNPAAGSIDASPDCLTPGPSRLREEEVFTTMLLGYRQPNGELGEFDPNDPNCFFIDTDGDGEDDAVSPNCPYQSTNALDSHHANLTLFTWLCSATIGFLDLDKTSCAQTVFGSTAEPAAGLAVAEIIGRMLVGDPLLNALLITNTNTTCQTPPGPCQTNTGPLGNSRSEGSKFLPYPLPMVLLSLDVGDQDSMGCTDFQDIDLPELNHRPCGGQADPITPLSLTLSPEQEALLGCGPFWGTNCDTSGIDLLNMEPSTILQSFAGASGTLAAIALKQQGIHPEGTAIIDPLTGQPAAFRAPNEYRTDEGLQPGTLPWEVAGIGGPLCSTADIGGNPYPRGQDTILVPGASGPVARPATRKEALPGCHRKWVDKVNGYLNLAWGTPEYMTDGFGKLLFDPVSGLPLQARDGAGAVLKDSWYYSGDPDRLGVFQTGPLSFPDAVRTFEYTTNLGESPILSPFRPDIGPGQPFAGRRAVAAGVGPGRPELTIPFASEMAGFSWNFQILGVAFSEEFQDALATVGDLADPDRNPCGGGFTYCGASLEGGSVPTDNPNNPNTIGSNKRIVAQMLYGYCGSDYGVVDPVTGLGTCRIDGNTNPLDELAELYQAMGINPNDVAATQAFQDGLQFRNVAMISSHDATADVKSQVDPNSPRTGRFSIIENQHCSFITPQYCSTVRNLFFLAGLKRNTLNAGGNGTYGRRTMQWHSGGEITLYVPKRNVLGFGLDFAEDRSKTNWGVEFTWIESVPTGDADEFDNTRNTDTFNLTVSVDRPTFVNFLNPNRTLFINSQWFFQYRRGTKLGFGGNGPFNALATLTVFTGYFQDRLNPSLTFVHDFQSGSGGLLPSINYRFNENFSATIGLAVFYGREQRADISSNGIGPASQQQGDWAYQGGAQNGISIVRDRDEAYLRIRYTF